MKKVFFTIMISFIAILLFTLNCYAADETIQWTDFSNAKAEVTQKDIGGYWEYNLKITGVTMNKESSYNVWITSGENEPNDKDSSESWIIPGSNIVGEVKNANSSLQEAYELNKDVYCYIVEKQGLNYGKMYKIKLPRLNQHKLGSRITASFNNVNTHIWFKEAHSIKNTRNIKVKIGKVTDKNILLSIKNGEANCLEKLLNYSKTADSIYTDKFKIESQIKSITSNMNIVDKEYYYVYMCIDDENGKYYPVEDVSLYQGLVSELFDKNLYDYLSNEFKWNIENGTTPVTPTDTTKTPTSSTDNNKTSTTTKKDDDKTMASGKLPQTGIGIGLILLIIVSVSGLIFAYFKYDRLKGIK